jgi:hypothetical protein
LHKCKNGDAKASAGKHNNEQYLTNWIQWKILFISIFGLATQQNIQIADENISKEGNVDQCLKNVKNLMDNNCQISGRNCKK